MTDCHNVPSESRCCRCGAPDGLTAFGANWWCSDCLWSDRKRLGRRVNEEATDIPEAMEQGGVDGVDRCHRAIVAQRRQIGGLQERTAELEAIVAQLPKCWRLVDGRLVQDCPVVPGMTVWWWCNGDLLCGDVFGIESGHETVVESCPPGIWLIFRDGEGIEPADCFDSLEAAEAARKEATS